MFIGKLAMLRFASYLSFTADAAPAAAKPHYPGVIDERHPSVNRARQHGRAPGARRRPVGRTQTQRAVQNFPISGSRWLASSSQHSASSLVGGGAREPARTARGKRRGCDCRRGGAGRRRQSTTDTSPSTFFRLARVRARNTNGNEVIARLATQLLGKPVHANDQVNMGQSSNDVIPTAIQVSAAIAVRRHLLPALERARDVLAVKEKEVGGIVKTGRTHLMDAMPVTLGQELSGWRTQVENGMARLSSVEPRLLALAQGGTAVGTGINAHPEFGTRFAAELAGLTPLQFTTSRNSNT